MDIEKCRLTGGQAMVELMIGLVGVVVLVAVIAQLASLVRAGHESAVDAREQAGRLALQSAPWSATANYIGATDPGPDDAPYTGDDRFLPGDAGRFHHDILDRLAAESSDWNLLMEHPDSTFIRLRERENPAEVFGLLRGQAGEYVNLLPAIRNLLYRDERIHIEETVWMPWTRGIY